MQAMHYVMLAQAEHVQFAAKVAQWSTLVNNTGVISGHSTKQVARGASNQDNPVTWAPSVAVPAEPCAPDDAAGSGGAPAASSAPAPEEVLPFCNVSGKSQHRVCAHAMA